MQFDLAELEILAKIVKAKYPSSEAQDAIEGFIHFLYQKRAKDKIHLFYKANKLLFEKSKI